jgi:hypothetical protein
MTNRRDATASQLVRFQEQPQPNAVSTTDASRSSPSPEVLSCLSQMNEMVKQQEALNQQNRLLLQTLNDLREDQRCIVSRIDSLPPINPQSANPLLPAAYNLATPSSPPPPKQAFSVADVPPGGDGHHVRDHLHAGAPMTHEDSTITAGASRADLALFHSSGMGPVAPANMASAPAAPIMGLEQADLQTVSSIIVQFISFAPSNALNIPRALDKVFMRFRFFDFQPTQTCVYLLDSVQRNQIRQVRGCQPPTCSPSVNG